MELDIIIIVFIIIIIILLLYLVGRPTHVNDNVVVSKPISRQESLIQNRNLSVSSDNIVQNHLNSIQYSKSISAPKSDLANVYYRFGQLHINDPQVIINYDPGINIVENAVHCFKMAYINGISVATYDIAKIYHYGIGGDGINVDKAYKYYKVTYKNNYVDSNIKDEVINMIIVMSEEEDDTKYITNIINETAEHHRIELQEVLNQMGGNVFEYNEPRLLDIEFITPAGLGLEIETVIGGGGNFWNNMNIRMTQEFQNRGGDTQNVHDRKFGNIMKENIERMNVGSTDNTYNNIENIINKSGLSVEITSNAKKVLKVMSKENQKLSRYDKTEMEILGMVYNRIQELSSSQQDNAKEMLVRQMAEGVELGVPVCATGRSMHVLSSLDGIDDNFVGGSTLQIDRINKNNVFHTELLNKASNIALKSNLSGDELQTKIRTDLHKEYVETGLMSNIDFNNDLDEWIEYIE